LWLSTKLLQRIENSQALLRRQLGSAPPGTLQRHPPAAAPAGAPRRKGWHGAALLPLGLDTPRRMGEGRAHSYPTGEGLGKGGQRIAAYIPNATSLKTMNA